MTAHASRRSYVRTYEGLQAWRRAPDYDFVREAVGRAGGKVLWTSPASVAPMYLAVEDPQGARMGLMIYVFHAGHRATRNRPSDEHRLQVRYGAVGRKAWREQHHPVGFDPAGVDLTAVLGVHRQGDVLVALDPVLYDPLPMGISVFFKTADVQAARAGDGWHVWERDNITGARRDTRSAELGVETLMAFRPERLFDYLRFERQAQDLRFDGPLRFRTAMQIRAAPTTSSGMHALEKALGLKYREILDLIAERNRLQVAVRGGVAERHLGNHLGVDRRVKAAVLGANDGPPDFHVTLRSGATVTVEVKNASPQPYADGTPKVEVQKTRASKSDKASRLYEPSAFDVLAACMYGPTGSWTFRYKRSEFLTRHAKHEGRIRPMQRIDDTWFDDIHTALAAPAGA